jgi:flagellar L-ring protein precursor FlgH
MRLPAGLVRLATSAWFVPAALSLGGCGDMMSRLADVGREPALTQIQNPVRSPAYRPVSMPMPQAALAERKPNSLWRPGARAFFKDQRAARVGDILTVEIKIEDKATINNKTTRTRANTEDASANAFLGYESSLSRILPETINPGNLIDLDSKSSHAGEGAVDRKETIDLKVAAVVTQRLPNGNLVVAGRQEVRVNFEVRQLQIAGVVRPEDISAKNTISYEKIAEARIAYGGKGQISDVQQPRYGQQVFDIIWPF